MRIKAIYRFVAIMLTLVLLVSTSVPALSLHFCQGSLAGISLFVSDTCCSSNTNNACSLTSQNTNDKDEGCCNDATITLDWNCDISLNKVQDNSSSVNSAGLVNNGNIFLPALYTSNVPVTEHDKPFLNQSAIVLFQRFLL